MRVLVSLVMEVDEGEFREDEGLPADLEVPHNVAAYVRNYLIEPSHYAAIGIFDIKGHAGAEVVG